jgi:hypothetical protein
MKVNQPQYITLYRFECPLYTGLTTLYIYYKIGSCLALNFELGQALLQINFS